ncbi:vir-repressed protein [Vogesella indigofera]|uniref:vir-repressed protein n=1 Tax=Vogesella indigofera TaxID=45465 RepID=UPI00234F949F|nr:vir-repressed protein [Vogesella indigofera]MDC7701988.1 vir-repressed protein [Vogesella indigofera]MDC7708002.1 vir-repressed protein [Vogesella indigofera]
MKTILFALIAASSLSACVVQPARVKLRSPIVLEPVVVEPVYDDHYHGGGGFCPPGQAKKGRC